MESHLDKIVQVLHVDLALTAGAGATFSQHFPISTSLHILSTPE